ncbi:MAG: riboflavin biosynthesis protein RibF [Clostridia bacterium]|nr:riboflavin biosynthesis protein RibF [Clostridia bacterium]
MKLLTHENQWMGGETVIVLGMFDGVHRGHEQLMLRANQLAQRDGLKSVVYTFSTHPMATFAPERVPPQLDTRSERIRSIAQKGVDAAVLRPFDRAFAALSPEAFVRLICETMQPRHVVIGFNYSFGCKGAGKAEDMIRLGKDYGFETHVVSEVSVGGAPVSSTRIRGAVTQGDMEATRELLDRPYQICGVVRSGKRLGRTLDFPTANLAYPKGKALPPCGVYAARVTLRGEEYIAAVNIGKHPTAPGGEETIEANLIDYDGGECYGCHMRVALYTRIREERLFDSLELLREEVLKNREQVRAYFARTDAPDGF